MNKIIKLCYFIENKFYFVFLDASLSDTLNDFPKAINVDGIFILAFANFIQVVNSLVVWNLTIVKDVFDLRNQMECVCIFLFLEPQFKSLPAHFALVAAYFFISELNLFIFNLFWNFANKLSERIQIKRRFFVWCFWWSKKIMQAFTRLNFVLIEQFSQFSYYFDSIKAFILFWFSFCVESLFKVRCIWQSFWLIYVAYSLLSFTVQKWFACCHQ